MTLAEHQVATDLIEWHHKGRTYQVAVPGYLDGLPSDAYHVAPGLSASLISHLLRSPAHYRWVREYGTETTDAMALGTLRHTLLLEPEEFDARYVVQPEGIDRRTKAGKQAHAELLERAEGREIIKQRDVDDAHRLVHAVRAWNKWPLLCGKAPVTERSYWWRDAETGVLCRCRVDMQNDDEDGLALVTDLKTTGDASPRTFVGQCLRLGYHRSAAWYSDGVRAVTGRKVDFVIVAAEYTAPCSVAGYAMTSSEAMTHQHLLGQKQNREALETLARCEAANDWPGYQSGEIRSLELPPWAIREAEEALEGLPSDPWAQTE